MHVSIGARQRLDLELDIALFAHGNGYMNASRRAGLDDEKHVMLAGGETRRERAYEATALHVNELVVLRRVQDDESLDTLRLEVEYIDFDADLLAETRFVRNLDLHVELTRCGYSTWNF